MNKSVGFALLWVVVGMALMAVIVWQAMPGMMLIQHKSTRNFADTVSALSSAVKQKQDWKVVAVYDYQKTIKDAGYGDMTRVGTVAICNPRYASKILKTDSDKRVLAFMPVGMGVYEDKDGNVYVSELNIGLMGKMFGGTIAAVMGTAGKDLKEIIASVEKQ